MRLGWIALALLLAPPAYAQQQPARSGYLLEFDQSRSLDARDFASRYGQVRHVEPDAIYLEPDPDRLKEVYRLYLDQQRDLRLRTPNTPSLRELEGVRIRRYNADPETSLFAPDARAQLNAEESQRLTRIEDRFAEGALNQTRSQIILRPNVATEFNEAFEQQNAFSLPMPDGEQRSFRPVLGRNTLRNDAWAGVSESADGSAASFDMWRRNGVLSGRLRADGVISDLYEISPGVFGWVHLEPELVSNGFTPDHPNESADRPAPRIGVPGAATGASPRACPVTPVPGASLRILFYYTPAALSAAMDKDFVGELDRPLMEFVRALELSEITSTAVETDEIVALPFAYNGDEGRSECADQGECVAPWSRHLFTFMRNPGVIAERRRRRADIVVLVVRDAGACGYTHPNVVPGGATSELAFAAVALSCLGGRATLAHELGHLLGTRHERPASSTDIAFAYQNRRPSKGWATVGAQSCYTEIGDRPGLRDLCSRNLYQGPRFSIPSMAPADDEYRANRNETEVVRRHLPCVASFGDRL